MSLGGAKTVDPSVIAAWQALYSYSKYLHSSSRSILSGEISCHVRLISIEQLG